MHPYIFNTFQKLISGRSVSGPVLEIGAVPNERTLLNLPALEGITDKTGLNLDGPYTFKDFRFVQCNANRMDIFPDNHFGLVLCNAMLEHDKFFWETIAEIWRVTRPGGLVMIGTPGYAENSFQHFKNRFSKYRWYRKLTSIAALDFLLSSTLTFEVHGGYYGDFYRFTPATYSEVFFRGYTGVMVTHVMQPPRIIGLCYKPA